MMKVLPHGSIVNGMYGSEDSFQKVLDDIKEHEFTGYLEVRMRIQGSELWGVIVFNEGRLVESYASRQGTDIFGENAYVYLLELSQDAKAELRLHELASDNILDFIMNGHSLPIKIEDGSWRPGMEQIPGFETEVETDDDENPEAKGEMIKKVVLLGDPSVGKTSIMRRYVEHVFDEAYLSTIGSNVNKKTISIIDDSLDESDETIIITLDTATNAVLGTTTVHTATIEDDDPPTVQFTSAAQSHPESIGSMTTTVTLDHSTTDNVTVSVKILSCRVNNEINTIVDGS